MGYSCLSLVVLVWPWEKRVGTVAQSVGPTEEVADAWALNWWVCIRKSGSQVSSLFSGGLGFPWDGQSLQHQLSPSIKASEHRKYEMCLIHGPSSDLFLGSTSFFFFFSALIKLRNFSWLFCCKGQANQDTLPLYNYEVSKMLAM